MVEDLNMPECTTNKALNFSPKVKRVLFLSVILDEIIVDSNSCSSTLESPEGRHKELTAHF